MSQPTAVSKRRRRAGVALVVVVALIGSFLAAVATRGAYRAEHRYAAHLMDRYTADLDRTITTEIQRYGDTLADVATALGAQRDLTSEDFTWVTTRVSTRRLPGATALAFVAATADPGIAALEDYWTEQGATDLTLHPARTGIEHRFTVFTRAFDGHDVVPGRDLAGVPAADAALTSARDTGAFAVSPAYVLPADLALPAADRQMSFTFAVPVYFLGGTFRGWLAMGVHGRDLLSQTLETQTYGRVAAELSDGGRIVASSGAPAAAPARLDRVTHIAAGDRTWELRVRPATPLLKETDRGLTLTALGVSAVIVLLATALVALLAFARNRAMAKVDTATAALREDIARRQEVETRLRDREQELQRLALRDPLTGLANRAGVDARLAEVVGTRSDIALLLLDLDDFKLVNDAYGHAAGDVVLTEFAAVLQAAVRAEDVAARIGGDEFVVLLTGIADDGEAVAAAERIAAAAAPVALGEDLIPVRVSIGVATPSSGESPKELLRRADMAMYEAKQEGTHGVRLHDPAMTDQRAADAQLGEELAGAVERDELTVLYQPLVDLADGRPVGVEALVRWEHPVLGLVSPTRFIPIAERTGMIDAIGLHVLREACRQIAAWGDGLYVSVNVSPRQLHEPGLVDHVLAALSRAGLEPSRLVLEITESALVDDAAGIEMLAELRRHGIRIAVDDFGTGYSSLHYLTRLPIDILKIDRSFVAQLDGTGEGAGIAEAIVRLSRALHLTTVAEGIETTDQATELQLLGCGIGQGYLFAKPMPADEALRMLASARPPSSLS
ncbi:putative bifunctional diguanylate cyclase/phosphodiesterase [Symbioplanes lichenis]|uniref:putative bifunctional diguanylate cyclase/phosphodiesterase n=1 Tax=Symbioplanes lichenis TaxID=1629072 RepID=UPI002739A0B9|nr:bifunctional diguanylate cyclase/phosphodiesterase [Actinoplanes lichenis]